MATYAEQLAATKTAHVTWIDGGMVTSYSVGGMSVSVEGGAEWREHIEWLEMKASEESSGASRIHYANLRPGG